MPSEQAERHAIIDPDHCDWCWAAYWYEGKVRYWYHLTFVYGGLALVFLACCLWVAWGCR